MKVAGASFKKDAAFVRNMNDLVVCLQKEVESLRATVKVQRSYVIRTKIDGKSDSFLDHLSREILKEGSRRV